ncbi:MAG: hypothetical protein ABF242_10260 [Flavobacteriales bacterium]
MANIQAKFISLKTNKLLQFIVYSNLWISLGTMLLCWQVFYLNNLEINRFYLLFVFLSTLVSYTAQRLFRLKSIAEINSKVWVVQNQTTATILVLIGLIGSLFTLSFFISFTVIAWLIPTGIISLLYSLKRLRDVPYLKIFLIAISWGIVCGVLPFILANIFDYELIIINFLIVTSYITAITIPFDIRDLGLDEDSKRTLPQLLGAKKAKNYGLVVLGLSTLLFFATFTTSQSLSFLFSSLISGILIYFSNEKKSDLYFTFLIDGHIILQFLLIFFFS